MVTSAYGFRTLDGKRRIYSWMELHQASSTKRRQFMKRKTTVKILLLTSFALLAAGSAVAADTNKDKPAPPGKSFNMTGTVTKHGIDDCMEGNVTHDLHPGSSTKTVRLSAKSKQDLAVLDKAAKSGGRVRVIGKKFPGLRPECEYVKTSKCVPLK